MARNKASEQAQALFERVLEPLIVGRAMHPIPPIKSAKAASVADSAILLWSQADASWIDVARVRQARLLCPVDVLSPPTRSEWLILVALNNLLCASDPEVNSLISPRRDRALLQDVVQILDLVPPSQTLHEVLGRHATFATVIDLQRVDTKVSWWCGSATFCGRTPAKRLLRWKSLRRVRTSETVLDLASMVRDESLRASHHEAVQRLLVKTPLTDLACADRRAPAFAWTSSTLALISLSAGRTLALRALRSSGSTRVAAALRRGGQNLSGHVTASQSEAVANLLLELDAYLAHEGDGPIPDTSGEPLAVLPSAGA